MLFFPEALSPAVPTEKTVDVGIVEFHAVVSVYTAEVAFKSMRCVPEKVECQQTQLVPA
jgi:hypothetical protein